MLTDYTPHTHATVGSTVRSPTALLSAAAGQTCHHLIYYPTHTHTAPLPFVTCSHAPLLPLPFALALPCLPAFPPLPCIYLVPPRPHTFCALDGEEREGTRGIGHGCTRDLRTPLIYAVPILPRYQFMVCLHDFTPTFQFCPSTLPPNTWRLLCRRCSIAS